MLDTLILLLVNPFISVALISLLLFFEYVLAKSIIKDTGIIDPEKMIKSAKQYSVKYAPLIYSQCNVTKKKLMNALINNGNSFSLTTSYKHIRQRIHHAFHN